MKRLSVLALLALSACDQAPPASDNAATPRPATAARTVAAPGAARADLTGYVGRYPFDRVNGTRFLDQPAVRGGVTRVVGDAEVTATILAGDGPGTPIVERDGQILSWGCETHNCGAHNWAILVSPDGQRPQVCYQPDGGAPRWYGTAPVGAAKDSCPSGNDEAL